MDKKPEDICPEPVAVPRSPTEPLAPPLFVSSVYRCRDPDEAERLLAGEEAGYVYRRDRHPNADMLADKCRQLHAAECAAVTSSGMSALALALLSQLMSGDHVVVSGQVYGATLELFTAEAARLDITSTAVDTCDLNETDAACTRQTRLVVAETIGNPLLRVADIARLAEIAHRNDARLLIDNTLASAMLCRPLQLGADLVVESLTKITSGHSDVVLGLLCGGQEAWQRVPGVSSRWGLASSPFDCWLALRGLGTLALRVAQASQSALQVAELLAADSRVEHVYYPGLAGHPDRALAAAQLAGQFGTLVTFTLRGGRKGAAGFMAGEDAIPFYPSLGELSTTLSHPESTSHRTLPAAQRQALGISPGTIRLSVGIERTETILDAVRRGLDMAEAVAAATD